MPHHMLIRRLLSVGTLSDDDQKALAGLPYQICDFRDGEILVRQGSSTRGCTVVMKGFLSRQRVVAERNQISAFYVPGDVPDLHTLHTPLMDHDLCSTGPSTVAFVSHNAIRQILRNSPGLVYAFWRETVLQAAIHRAWVENLGARNALPRVAHLICEIATRLQQVGLAVDGKLIVPFTQAHIADACGFSSVHVNRTIQELRRRRLIDWQNHTIEVLAPQELESIADFNRDYLHQACIADAKHSASPLSAPHHTSF